MIVCHDRTANCCGSSKLAGGPTAATRTLMYTPVNTYAAYYGCTPCRPAYPMWSLPIDKCGATVTGNKWADAYTFSDRASAQAACIAEGCTGLADPDRLDTTTNKIPAIWEATGSSGPGRCLANWWSKDRPAADFGTIQGNGYYMEVASLGCANKVGYITWGNNLAGAACIGCPNIHC